MRQPAGVGSTSSRFRQRKLNVKAHLPILRESDFSSIDGHEDTERQDAGLTSLPKLESGVEKGEEKEHHLQMAMQSAAVGGKVAQIYIPTPDAVPSDIQYDSLYPARFAQPATYIRFSSTVEDSVGCPYCMTEDDEEVLKSINSQRSQESQCTEDQFEIVMNFFEETCQARQPYAAMDGTPVLSFEEMEAAFDDAIDDAARYFAEEIYNHWQARRTEKGNRGLMAKLKTLKIDGSQETDDADPYVCFRRREVRQARKTRGRDAQVIEKLKRLRKELEEGRHLLHLVRNREEGRREDLRLSRQVFEQRAAVRQMKQSLGIQDDDSELLVNQRAPKQPPEVPPAARISTQPRLSRADSIAASAEVEMVLFRDKFAEQERMIKAEMDRRVRNLDAWSSNYIDNTLAAVTGTLSPAEEKTDPIRDFVGIQVQSVWHPDTQQPTPPASATGESPREEGKMEVDQVEIQWESSTQAEQNPPPRTLYRRRRGRGGIMIDRHNCRGKKRDLADSRTRELYKYDRESGDEASDEDDQYKLADPAATPSFKYRCHLRAWEVTNRTSAHSRNSSLTDVRSMSGFAPGQD